MTLARRTPLRSTAKKPKRLAVKCVRRGCTRPPARNLDMCRTHARMEADRLFSLIVRSRGACFRCGTTTDLQCSHTIPRSYRRTRWDVEAAECACRACHRWQHAFPVENELALTMRMGPDALRLLRCRALVGPLPDYTELLPRLKRVWAQIQRERA